MFPLLAFSILCMHAYKIHIIRAKSGVVCVCVLYVSFAKFFMNFCVGIAAFIKNLFSPQLLLFTFLVLRDLIFPEMSN